MTNQEIIDSSAFKVLNHMIDTKVSFIESSLPYIKRETDYAFEGDYKYKSYLTTRVHDEGGDSVDLPVDLSKLKRIAEIIQDVIRTEEEINELQRQKLRLLNDYDFTHGDDSEQKKIFG
jgi:hypothetical protein